MNSLEGKGINEFIRYKRSVERERPVLTSEPRIVTIDGIDGSGKSTIARKVFEKLQEKYGPGRVVLVDVTNLSGSVKQEKLGTIAKLKSLTGEQIDRIYAAGVNRAYEELILPALKDGKIVIVDRSEIDLLRFALESKNQSLINQRRKYIQEGAVTHRLWAGNRVFIEIEAKDAWKNLSKRQKSSQYDPKSFEETQRRITFQEQAEKEVETISHVGEVKTIREKNIRIKDPIHSEQFLEELAERIVNNLDLS